MCRFNPVSLQPAARGIFDLAGSWND